jgi:hypothetical protein
MLYRKYLNHQFAADLYLACTNSWKDHSTNWVKLKDMKNAYPIEVTEYAIANKIHEELAFTW